MKDLRDLNDMTAAAATSSRSKKKKSAVMQGVCVRMRLLEISAALPPAWNLLDIYKIKKSQMLAGSSCAQPRVNL